jgi:ABC-type multidrug transport system fused ATPase/permease subunit
MKLLLQAAIRNSKHVSLAILTFFALVFLTISNQLEMFSVGLITDTTADFFSMFGEKKQGRIQSVDRVEFDQVVNKWKDIDKDNKGYITKKDTVIYTSKKRDSNPIKHIFRKASAKLDIEKNFFILIIFLVTIAILKASSLFTARYMTQVLSIRITRDLRQQFFQHIQSLPLSFYNEYDLGSLVSRAVGDAGQIASSLNSMLINYLQTPVTVFASLFFCFYISWELSLIIFVGVPFAVIPIIYFTKKIKKITRQLQKKQESFTSVLLDFLAGIHTIKIYAMEQFSLKKYEEQNNNMAKLEVKNAKYSLFIRPVLHAVTTTCLATILLFGVYTLRMTIAQLITFCGSLYLFYEPVKKFAEENANIQKGVVAAERMFEVLDLKPKITDLKSAVEFKSFNDEISFNNVWFKYKDQWVLRDLSFSVKKGQTVAIVGPTGAGKSTIVQLISRLYDVQKGSILIDGKSVKEFTQKSLKEQIAFIPQKPFLFYDTVLENICFGNKFCFEKVLQAAKNAYAHEFIENLPNKYQTVLAETGKNLSGGQQQRLAIARALIKDVSLLIMDEATSSLDAVSEDKIKLAIQNLRGTQIIIAHRLSTIEHADKIIYLDQGMKLAEGTKEELLINCPQFKHMWETFHRIKRKDVSLNI